MNHYPNLSIGTLLLRPKCLGIVQHEGVVVGYNAVLHNTPEKGEHVSTFTEYAAGHPVKAYRTDVSPEVLNARARKVLSNPKQYDLFARNCQHTASSLLRGVAKSPWIATIIIIVAIIAGVWLVSAIVRRA